MQVLGFASQMLDLVLAPLHVCPSNFKICNFIFKTDCIFNCVFNIYRNLKSSILKSFEVNRILLFGISLAT